MAYQPHRQLSLDPTDGLAIAGLLLIVAGLWITFGFGSALIAIGLVAMLIAWCVS